MKKDLILINKNVEGRFDQRQGIAFSIFLNGCNQSNLSIAVSNCAAKVIINNYK
ncbi:MAG: hypothetical protein WCQ70_02685 [Lentimicrobiaceae bacterium]